VKRREFVSLVGAAAGAVPFGLEHVSAAQAPAAARKSKTEPPARATMTVGCQRSPTDAKMLMYFKRHAVDHICGYPPNLTEKSSWTAESLQRLREQCEAGGVALDMVQFPLMASSSLDQTDRKGVMLAKEPDRQQDIDQACEIIKNCATAGIPAIKYNMTLLGVLRTGTSPGRGGTRYSTWKLAEAKEDPPLTAAGAVNADQMWERITYFLERVVPVAEQYRVRIACHPHDPGVPPRGFRGVVRVLGTVDGLKRFVEIKASRYHGLNLCLGSVAEMLQDPNREIHDVIRYFGERHKIFNIHFRNIRGKRDDFVETFPDEGSMDMAKVMMTLREVGYPYMVMPDHMPRHVDDPDQHQAFAFGYGYIRALIQVLNESA
jgi:mannonate dehydratase